MSNDGGSTWSGGALPEGVTGLGNVTCATPTSCVAIGFFLHPQFSIGAAVFTEDGGSTWSRGSLPTSGELIALSCPSSSRCVTIAIDLGLRAQKTLLTTDGGHSWSATALPGDAEPDNDSDDSWATGALPGSRPNELIVSSISCPTTSRCVAAGGSSSLGSRPKTLLLYSTDGGASWGETTLPSGLAAQLDAVSCPSASRCVVVGSASGVGMALFSADGGASWLQAAVPGSLVELDAVSCWTPSDCVSVSGLAGPGAGSGSGPAPPTPTGAVFTHDGGVSWS
ncbi:MAG: hypothetical protein E6J14_01365 [Chloroflexi bacterium]|nr:MAG: hypothetical protein E6J14_01365 [Chloroflexota bacterium]